MRGTIRLVETTIVQTILLGDHEPGAPALAVDNVTDFELSGQLVIESTSEIVDYDLVLDGDSPADSGVTVDTIILSQPYIGADGAGLVDGEVISAYPPDTRKRAHVDVGDPSPVIADVPPHYAPLLQEDVALAVPAEVILTPAGWVISHVDPSKTPSVDARYLTRSTVQPEAIDADTWTRQGKTVDLLSRETAHHPALRLTGATVESGAPDSGLQRAVLDGDGFHHNDVSGTPLVTTSVEPDARPHWRGVGDLDSGTADTFAIKQQADVLAGASINLLEQVREPAHGPTATRYWPFTPIDDLNFSTVIGGLEWDHVVGAFVAPYWDGADLDAIVSIDLDTGVLTPLVDLTGTDDDYYWGRGFVRIGDEYFLGCLRADDLASIIVVYDAIAGDRLRTLPYTRQTQVGGIVPIIGKDGVNLLVADVTPDGHVIVNTLDPATGIATQTPVVLPLLPASGQQLAGIQRGTFDLGYDAWVVWADQEKKRNVLVAATVDPSDWINTDAFSFANDETVYYGCWSEDLACFASASESAGIWRYLGPQLDGLTLSIKIGQTLYNDAHGYETTLSDTWTRIKGAKRAGLRVNSGTLPGSGGDDDPTHYRIYTTNGDGLSLATWWLVGVTDPITGDLIITDPLPEGSPNPPATNTFPAGDAGSIRSSTGQPIIEGVYTNPRSLAPRVDDLEVAGGILGVEDDIYLGSDYIEVSGRG